MNNLRFVFSFSLSFTLQGPFVHLHRYIRFSWFLFFMFISSGFQVFLFLGSVIMMFMNPRHTTIDMTNGYDPTLRTYHGTVSYIYTVYRSPQSATQLA